MSLLSPLFLVGPILLMQLATPASISFSPSVSNFWTPQLQSNLSIGTQNLTTHISSIPTVTGTLFSRILNVPGTSTILHLSYGWGRRRALSPNFVQDLIVTTQDYLWDRIAQHGAAIVYPFTADYKQDLFRSLGDGIYLEIENLGGRLMSWGDLEVVLEGLNVWFLRMHQFKQVYFSFENDGGPLGQGRVALDRRTVATDVVKSVE